MTIKRVCGAIIRDNMILMVKHRHNGNQYWTLPGGGVEKGETPKKAIIREVSEEANIDTEIIKPIFDEDFENGLCRCFLLKEVDPEIEPYLGIDPEEIHLPQSDRMLQKLEWKSMQEFSNDRQVKKVLSYIKYG